MIFFGSLESPELEEFICSTSGHSEATGIEHRGIGFDRKMKVALISAQRYCNGVGYLKSVTQGGYKYFGQADLTRGVQLDIWREHPSFTRRKYSKTFDGGTNISASLRSERGVKQNFGGTVRGTPLYLGTSTYLPRQVDIGGKSQFWIWRLIWIFSMQEQYNRLLYLPRQVSRAPKNKRGYNINCHTMTE